MCIVGRIQCTPTSATLLLWWDIHCSSLWMARINKYLTINNAKHIPGTSLSLLLCLSSQINGALGPILWRNNYSPTCATIFLWWGIYLSPPGMARV